MIALPALEAKGLLVLSWIHPVGLIPWRFLPLPRAMRFNAID